MWRACCQWVGVFMVQDTTSLYFQSTSWQQCYWTNVTGPYRSGNFWHESMFLWFYILQTHSFTIESRKTRHTTVPLKEATFDKRKRIADVRGLISQGGGQQYAHVQKIDRVYLYALWSHWPWKSRRALNTKRDPGNILLIGTDQFNINSWIKNRELHFSHVRNQR